MQATPFVPQVWSVNSVRHVPPAQQAFLHVSASQPEFGPQAAARSVASASETARTQHLMLVLLRPWANSDGARAAYQGATTRTHRRSLGAPRRPLNAEAGAPDVGR
jgi:hypothetical protein